MSNKRAEAQQQRRQREREASAAAEANAAAASIPNDAQVEFQPDDGEVSGASESRRNDDEAPRFVARQKSARELAMEELVTQRQEAQEPNPEEPAAESAPEPDQEPAPAPEPVAAQQEAPKTVRVKIDHEELDVPAEEVEAYGGQKPYQIAKALERRLVAANALLAQTKQATAPVEAPKPEPTADEMIREAVSKIQIASPEEGAVALAGVLQRLVPKAPDTAAITQQAVVLMQATQAENAFVTQNRDLVENPMIKQLLVMEKQRRLQELRQQNRLPDDWNTFYDRIAIDVRAALGRQAPTPAPNQPAAQPTSIGSAVKEARKASIVALPTASARATLPEEEKPPTRAQLLDEMRKARGQPV